MIMPIPKCTLTDAEIFEINPPAMHKRGIIPLKPTDVAPELYVHLRAMIDKCVARMVENGDLIAPDRPNHLFSKRNHND